MNSSARFLTPPRLTRAVGVILATVAGGRTLLCAAPPRAASPRAPSVVLITLDTFRRDRLAAWGGSPALAPHLNAFFHGAEVYRNTYTPAPLTLPAHASLLTGLPPRQHGVRDNGQTLPAGVVTMAEKLSAAGYDTAAFVSTSQLAAQTGLNRGFSVYREMYDAESLQAPAFATIAAVREFLAARRDSRPLFLWVHLYDAHWPYLTPGEVPPDGRGTYDHAIAYLDGQFAQLLALVHKSLPSGNTLIAVAGDHGESLGEHGEATHGFFLYDATLAVPLAIRRPGGAGKIIAAPVSLENVPNLLLPKLFPPPPPGDAQIAESLHPLLTYGWPVQVAVRRGERKAIAGAALEWYDLAADPGETRDQFKPGALPPALESALRAAAKAVAPQASSTSGGQIPETLRGLSYANPLAAGLSARAMDPAKLRGMVGRAELIIGDTLLGRELSLRGATGPAEHFLAAALRENPGYSGAHYWHAVNRLTAGDAPGAIGELRAFLKDFPGDRKARLRLAGALCKIGNTEEARTQYDGLIAKNGNDDDARLGLAHCAPSAVHP